MASVGNAHSASAVAIALRSGAMDLISSRTFGSTTGGQKSLPSRGSHKIG